MQKFSTIFIAVLLSVIAAYLTVKMTNETALKNGPRETIYERVMRTKTIRCGYLTRPPFFSKDPNTKALSGIFYDITEELGKRLNLKIDWVEETTPAEFILGLENNRFDTVCHGAWLNAQRARVIDFTTPVLYDVAGVFVRNNDPRFNDKKIQDLNGKDLKFSVMEGAPTQYLTDLNFPDAQKVTTPQGTTPAQVALDLAAGKSDLAVYPLSEGVLFSQNRPDTLHALPLINLGSFSMSYPVLRGQDEFRQMMSNVIMDMQNQGVIDKIVDKYPVYKNIIKRVHFGNQD